MSSLNIRKSMIGIVGKWNRGWRRWTHSEICILKDHLNQSKTFKFPDHLIKDIACHGIPTYDEGNDVHLLNFNSGLTMPFFQTQEQNCSLQRSLVFRKKVWLKGSGILPKNAVVLCLSIFYLERIFMCNSFTSNAEQICYQMIMYVSMNEMYIYIVFLCYGKYRTLKIPTSVHKYIILVYFI